MSAERVVASVVAAARDAPELKASARSAAPRRLKDFILIDCFQHLLSRGFYAFVVDA